MEGVEGNFRTIGGAFLNLDDIAAGDLRTVVGIELLIGYLLVDILPSVNGGDSFRMSRREARPRLGGFLGRRHDWRSISAG